MVIQEFVNRLAAKSDISKAKARLALDEFIQCIHESLSDEGRVAIPHLGTLTVKRREERTIKSGLPNVGERVVPASNGIRFKPAKSLKESVN